jgi:ketosteroid isomerase-like protein
MSQEDVEIVRRFNERWIRGDWAGLVELVDPCIEQHGAVGGIEEGRLLYGLDEIRRDWEAVEAQWDEHRVEPQEFIDAGDRVVVLIREYQRGIRSGIELSVDTAVIADLRHGRIVRIQGYVDQVEALKAVGLEDG